GLTAGSYTVTVTDANGCTATRNYTITQPTAINTATGSQTNVSCNGGSNGSASVTPSGGTPGYTYSWSPSGGTAATATGLTAGSYTVTVTDANGCTATRNYTITEPAAIDATTTLIGSTITANQAGATYQWFECPSTILIGENGQSFTPTVNGSYGVTITMGGCDVTSSCVLVNTLANPDFEEKSKFTMYPNPNKGIINIQCDYDGDLNITNQLGQTIKTVKVFSDRINTINIEHLSDGIYLVSEKKGNKTITHKLILKK
ncbi:T9SS type A sorting domain-containing protein, partial [Flavobacterium sp.]|uniref:T9SS type A sorting domain-containing protein n=1 Tax=Flavobacterium sp. TaxID=239 RepID=UPI003266C0FA